MGVRTTRMMREKLKEGPVPHTSPSAAPINRKSLEDFEFLLAQHDQSLISVKGEIGEIKTKMDQVVQAINTLTIASNRSPFDVSAMVSTLRDAIIIFSSIVAGIIYVTTSQFAADWARQGEYNKQVLKDLSSFDARISRQALAQNLPEVSSR
jgi:hypothetical protein